MAAWRRLRFVSTSSLGQLLAKNQTLEIYLDSNKQAKPYCNSKIPESEHVAGNFGVIVVKLVTTYSSPDAVEADFQTAFCRITVSTDKSR